MSRRRTQQLYTLGLNLSASQEVLKQRYRALAPETHPDRKRGGEEEEEEEEEEEASKVRFQAISAAYEKLMIDFDLMLKPLPPAPSQDTMIKLDESISDLPSPADIPLPSTPIPEPSSGPVTRSTSRRKPIHLEATWQAASKTGAMSGVSPLESPMPPPVPLKVRSKSVPRLPSKSPQSPISPRGATVGKHSTRNFSFARRDLLSPTFEGISKQNTHFARSIHDFRASMIATLTSLQGIASSTTTKPDEDAMCCTLQRLKRRMLNGRHRKIVHTVPAAVQHWDSLEQGLLKIQRRSYEVDAKGRIDLQNQGKRNEIVGLLNAWEQEVRRSWTNDW